MIKDILVHVDNSHSARTRISTAIALSKKHNANLTGIYADDWAEHIMMMAPEIVPAVTESQRELWEQRQAQAKQLFKEVTETEQLPCNWISLEGEITKIICSKTYYCDLTVLQQHDSSDPRVPDFNITHGLLLGSACPILVIPNNEIKQAPGKHIMIAWKDSKESARAVTGALPFLQQADKVELVNVQSGAETSDIESLTNHLERHNVKTTHHIIDNNQFHPGEALLSFAQDNKVDMLVMGAYGHSRLREVILGGTTRYLLKNTTVPLLLSH